MRLIRLAPQPATVAEDIRAALASLGHGTGVTGGLALAGVRPPEHSTTLDALVITPRGVLIVIGVDLPDPAMRLEAPLRGQWKSDGWPLVRGGDAVNPATEPLATATRVAARIRSVQGDLTVGTILAVGPFVQAVDQPATDLTGDVRVVHPTATSMLAAVASLATGTNPMSTGQVRALLRALAPGAPEVREHELRAEGFVEAQPPVPAEPTGQPVSTPVAPAGAPPGPTAAPPGPRPVAPSRKPAVRWLPITAIALLLGLLVTAIVLAASGKEPTAEQPPPSNPTPAPHTVDGIDFVTVAATGEPDCAPHATGDVQARLSETGCAGLRRGSFTASVEGGKAAVSIAVLRFAEPERASELRKLSDTPGSGAILDLGTASDRWPQPAPDFAGSAYVSRTEGATLRLVQVSWIGRPSTPDDPTLVRTATTALTVPLPG
ncbi:hypothetical protein [Amycolatopsis cihanbeyliensis]|uniref:Uncharacterized protein n=1 Tax=Amycolatopsis cihanbeyliensis TaxID=1128664 RepID=A0A542DGQ8_AMYCI|nr:hypothetical protein [Amycolatopsis cihanbeyliensis]TQJ02221.1 hypothetical protein FB471_1942 [Amycolatopsis cihanbeyliensis]